ncbi:MotA/TolQ/ExbB proton channel family protein [Pantanalinema sp. GBBB05]|uniref:MotA/TolQ/ExbB proton channel family protein n=1 Tax=Pantanalinema sp. GBBB05 TaxID=2604139 RepID=UPI001D2F17C4|nr:MotA/TolQ/ExbB proton channel family protein [Pantanalinema sp. GBBB05]
MNSIVYLFTAGGVVMVPLLVFSVLAIALIAERLRFWVRIIQRHQAVAKSVMALYQEQPKLVMDKLNRNRDLPLARIFMAPLSLDQPTPEEFRLALESELQAEIPVLKRFGSIFEMIVGLSPLLGLLGTVLGLITAFGSLNIGDIGGTRTAGVSAGISEALVSTAAGLVVATVVLMFASIFRALYQRQLALIQEYGGQLELLYRHHYDRIGQDNSVIRQLSAAIQQLALSNSRSH